MNDKIILCLIILAQWFCVSAICEITSAWFKKKDKFKNVFSDEKRDP